MKVDYWQSVRPIVNRVLPREYREDYLDGLDENPNTGIKFAREAVVTVASTWASNAVAAFNRWGYLVESALAMFCLFRSTLPWSAACAHAAIMITLICRDAYTFHFVEPNRPQSWKKYHVDSTVDGVVAGVVLLGSQMLWLKFAPSLALPAAVLFRGAVVGLPLISAARAALRPKPDPKLPFDANFDDADAVYKRVWWLNVLWLFAFYALMLENASDKPGNPMDFVRGWMFYPLVVWNVLQSDMLSRKCTIETLFMNHQVNKLRRMQAWLAQGMKKGQPLYGWWLTLSVLIWGMAALSLGDALWPWLSGESVFSLVRAMGGVVTFSTSMMMWRYVKAANHAAARVLEAAIQVELKNRPGVY